MICDKDEQLLHLNLASFSWDISKQYVEPDQMLQYATFDQVLHS